MAADQITFDDGERIVCDGAHRWPVWDFTDAGHPRERVIRTDEMIGRVDKLDTRRAVKHWKAGGVDLSRILAGPYCTLMMAELGARVIKVEVPGTGDDARQYGPFRDGQSAYFMSINRGKESIALDLKAPGDRAGGRDLCSGCSRQSVDPLDKAPAPSRPAPSVRAQTNPRCTSLPSLQTSMPKE